MNIRILHGDALEQLRTLPNESVQCVVTSPPYYGLRDYGTGQWDGGADDCDHKGPPQRTMQSVNANTNGGNDIKVPAMAFRDECGKCGATRIDDQIGLESSPTEYIAKLVAVFAEVRRVLRKDGVAWVNMGDSYASGGRGGNPGDSSTLDGTRNNQEASMVKRSMLTPAGLKPKDLMGMPWRLAFALQADGWWLRQDIIWHKPNPMPESVTDRCTKAHEYVFLLTKSAQYYYDAEAISEPAILPPHERNRSTRMGDKSRETGNHGLGAEVIVCDGTRNKRSVWTITTEPYPDAHFATFPTELPRICILAGSKLGDVILDPFAGSGTTLQVALELGRQGIGIELNAEYVALANRRLSGTTLGLPLERAA